MFDKRPSSPSSRAKLDQTDIAFVAEKDNKAMTDSLSSLITFADTHKYTVKTPDLDILLIMALKWLALLTLVLLTIEYTECKTPSRVFVMKQDTPPKKKPLHDFTAYDAREKARLYLIRTTTTDVDAINIFDYRARSMVANVEGEWIGGVFNATLSIFDSKSEQWIEGTMSRTWGLFKNTYKLRWNNDKLLIKRNMLSKTVEITDELSKQLLATFRYRSIWRAGLKFKYDVKIYTTRLPDSLYILIVTIFNHAEHINIDEDR